MPGLTLTLTTHAVVYNVFKLITATTGYSQTKVNCRELILLGNPGNLAGNIFVGGSDVSSTNFGERLTASQSTLSRSGPVNGISLADIWVTPDTDGIKLNVRWDYL